MPGPDILRVGSGGHNITETKYAYKASLSREEFLAQNEFGQMISDPKTADPASREHRKFVAEFQSTVCRLHPNLGGRQGQRMEWVDRRAWWGSG